MSCEFAFGPVDFHMTESCSVILIITSVVIGFVETLFRSGFNKQECNNCKVNCSVLKQHAFKMSKDSVG